MASKLEPAVVFAVLGWMLSGCAGPHGVKVGEAPPLARTPSVNERAREPDAFSNVFCGANGQSCCRPPVGSEASKDSTIVTCHDGLGCDLTTHKCVEPCGADDQACCDGPSTTATRWNDQGQAFSPTNPLLTPMCSSGRCEPNTHRCMGCGTVAGQACCSPDARQGTAFCIGGNLECAYGDNWNAGSCRACSVLGEFPCERSGACNPGLDLRQGRCALCGASEQLPCDNGCKGSLRPASGVCRVCGSSGIIQCDSGCNAGLKAVQGICRPCSGTGQIPCDWGCESGLEVVHGLCQKIKKPPSEVQCPSGVETAHGRCTPGCGYPGNLPCDGTGCRSGEVSHGLCK